MGLGLAQLLMAVGGVFWFAYERPSPSWINLTELGAILTFTGFVVLGLNIWLYAPRRRVPTRHWWEAPLQRPGPDENDVTQFQKIRRF